MSIFRSYFEKNTTILYKSQSNTARNEVFELTYGRNPDTDVRVFSRYLFKVDTTNLFSQINSQTITNSNVISHKLRIYNCIAMRDSLIGRQFSDGITNRASDFDLILFKIPEDWSEGTGYEYNYSTRVLPNINISPANWIYRKQPNIAWTEEGIFTGTPTDIIATIHLDRGNENIDVDVTTYVNDILFSGGTNNGLGLAFASDWENKDVYRRFGVSFFSKYTSTFFEPFIETTFNDNIIDDRNEFYLDKTNNLFLYTYIGGELKDLDNIPTEVELFDEEDDLYATISAVTKVKKGTYKITFDLKQSDGNIDMVIYRDKWKGLVYDGVILEDKVQSFTLLPASNYYKIDTGEQNNVNDVIYTPNNFYIEYNGILHNEKLTKGDVRRVIISLDNKKQQDSIIYMDAVEYRLYIKQGTTEIEVIPFTQLNKTNQYYFFDIDTSWLIPNHYYIQTRFKRNNLIDTRKEMLKFTISNEMI